MLDELNDIEFNDDDMKPIENRRSDGWYVAKAELHRSRGGNGDLMIKVELMNNGGDLIYDNVMIEGKPMTRKKGRHKMMVIKSALIRDEGTGTMKINQDLDEWLNGERFTLCIIKNPDDSFPGPDFMGHEQGGYEHTGKPLRWSPPAFSGDQGVPDPFDEEIGF